MTSVGFAGDWHGDTGWAVGAVRRFADAGVQTIFHVGDFGIWPGVAGDAYLDTVERALRARGAVLAVTPGNHEDYDQIGALCPRTEHHWSFLGDVGWLRPHLAVFPRGHRWTMPSGSGIRTFVSLGGASSVDRSFRTPLIDWWPQEAIRSPGTPTEASLRSVWRSSGPAGMSPAGRSTIGSTAGWRPCGCGRLR